MFRRTLLLVFVTFCVSIGLLNGQCVPKSVVSITILPNHFLSWTLSPQETCTIISFQIVISRDGHEEYHLNVTETQADVSFLTVCQYWTFNITAVSPDAVGTGHIFITRTPIPPDANIAVKTLEVDQEHGRPRLVWELEDDTYQRCVDLFRVSIEDEEDGDIGDIYVNDESLFLDFLSPCVNYEFGIRAISNSRPTVEGPLRSIEYEAASELQTPPKLAHVSVGSTAVNTTWILDDPIANRCPVRTLYVDGGQYFNVSIPISDTPEREPVWVHLDALQPNSLYLLKVSVENSAGVSNPTQLGVQTLDLEPSV